MPGNDGERRVRIGAAYKYHTLYKAMDKEDNDKLIAIESEFGEKQPIKATYICDNKKFRKLKSKYKIACLEEYVKIFRYEMDQKSKGCEVLNSLLHIECKFS